MIPPFNPSILEFLSQFFGEGNKSKLEDIYKADSGHAKIKPLVDRLLKDPQPTVIPYTDKNNKVFWYGLAFSEAQFSYLAESLQAFLGPSFSTLQRGLPQDPTNRVEKLINMVTCGRYFVFEADNSIVMRQLDKMFNVWNMRPSGYRFKNINIDQLLRDFYTALQIKEEQLAREAYHAIRDLGQLSAQNVLFLHIQMLAAFARWDDMYILQGLKDVVTMRRPVAVTDALLQGIYYLELKKFEDNGDKEGIIKHFEEEVWPLYSNLFHTHRGLHSIESLKTFAIRAVAAKPLLPEHADIKDLISGTNNSDFYDTLLSKLEKSTTVGSTLEGYDLAKKELDNGNADIAFNILLRIPISVKQTSGLLDCAFVLLDLETVRKALDAFGSLNETEQETIVKIPRMHSTLILLKNLGQSQRVFKHTYNIPEDWHEWIKMLSVLDEGLAIEVAIQGSKQWEFDGFYQKDLGLSSFFEQLQTKFLDPSTQNKLGFALPHLISFFREENEWPRVGLRRLYMWLASNLLTSSSGSKADFLLYCKLLKDLLPLGTDKEGYLDLLGSASSWISEYANLVMKDSVFECINLLSIYPCFDQLARIRLVHAIETRLGTGLKNDSGWSSVRLKMIPANWVEWFSTMKVSSSDIEVLLKVMPMDSGSEWSHAMVSSIEDHLLELLLELEESLLSKTVVETILQKLTDDMINSDYYPKQGYESVYESILMLMDQISNRNRENTLIFLRLIDGMLQISPQSADNRWKETERWFVKTTPFMGIVKFFLDAMDLFFDSPISNELLKSLWNQWFASLTTEILEGSHTQIVHWHRAGMRVGGAYELLNILEKALQVPVDDDPFSQLENLVITIYTLKEKPAARVVDYLKDCNPKIKVRVCTDDRLTDRAKEYARNSDISVIVTTCISHALTKGIAEYLKSDPVYPRSSGESSIIDAIEQYARRLSE